MMFSWFRRKPRSSHRPPEHAYPAPTPAAYNSSLSIGQGNQINPPAADNQSAPFAQVDLVQLLTAVLRAAGHASDFHDSSTLRLNPTALLLRPNLEYVQPLQDGGFRTVTTIHAAHPLLGNQDLFEYQHSTGDNLEDALRKGFEQWVQIDLVVLLDALALKPAQCMLMEMTFPASENHPEPRARRAVLGPAARYTLTSPTQPTDKSNANPEDHDFCPCCFFTRTFDAFKSLIESDTVHAIRFFAQRDADGAPQADCRVNGQDYPQGADALRRYVTTWPQAGFEFRKQYVILQNTPHGGDE